MLDPYNHLDPASLIVGRFHAKLEARVTDLEEWRLRRESFESVILGYLRRVCIALAMSALALLTSALPGSPLKPLGDALIKYLAGS